ncbi:MAG: hypothetical protein JNM27_09610 [Leptospirales bacterium]|nr:hypothetical protein [Leptospirales bacterium]
MNSDMRLILERSQELVQHATNTIGYLNLKPQSESGFVFRCTVLPSFHIPYCITIESDYSVTFVYSAIDAPIEYSFSHDMLAELPGQDLSCIPANWFSGQFGKNVHDRKICRVRFNAPDGIDEILEVLKGVEASFPVQFEPGEFNRLDGTDLFVEFGRIRKFLAIYETEKHPDSMRLIDLLSENYGAFLARISSAIYLESRNELKHLGVDEIVELVSQSRLSDSDLALLYCSMPIVNFRDAILQLKNGRQILFESERLKPEAPGYLDIRDQYQTLLKPKWDQENRIEEALKAERVAIHNALLSEVIDDLGSGILHCPRCQNRDQFKIKNGTPETKGYVICKQCGLSIYDRSSYSSIQPDEADREAYLSHLTNLVLLLGSESASEVYAALNRTEIEELTRRLNATENRPDEKTTFEFFLGRRDISLAMQRSFLEKLIRNPSEFKFRLKDLQRSKKERN